MAKYKGIEFEESLVINYMVAEGFKFEEAVLKYKERKKLPSRVFCGPSRSYPAHDAKHVANTFARLSQFGGRLGKSVVAKIHGCLVRKAKRFGVEHKGCKWCKKKEKVEETVGWFKELPENKEFFKVKEEKKEVEK